MSKRSLHMSSSYRAQPPELYNKQVPQWLRYDKHWNMYYCIMCGAWCDDTHVTGKQHTKRFWSHRLAEPIRQDDTLYEITQTYPRPNVLAWQDPRSAGAASVQLPARPSQKAPPPGLLSTVQTMTTTEARICRMERSVAELQQTVEKLRSRSPRSSRRSRSPYARSEASGGS